MNAGVVVLGLLLAVAGIGAYVIVQGPLTSCNSDAGLIEQRLNQSFAQECQFDGNIQTLGIILAPLGIVCAILGAALTSSPPGQSPRSRRLLAMNESYQFHWICPRCRSFNNEIRDVADEHCPRCGAQRDDKWQCDKCQRVNYDVPKSPVQYCPGCGSPKPRINRSS